MKILFICDQNLNRSRTAEKLFRGRFETQSAGLYNDNPVSKNQIKWADVIATMEGRQANEVAERFAEALRKKIVYLAIPDVYQFGEPALIDALNKSLERALLD